MKNLVLGETIKVVGGKHIGKEGIIVGISNRSNGMSSYLLKFKGQNQSVYSLQKFVIPIKSRDLLDSMFNDSYLRKWVTVTSTDNIVDQSLDKNSTLHVHKKCLVTDEWEEDNKTLLNVVFQGNYAVLPKGDVELTEDKDLNNNTRLV